MKAISMNQINQVSGGTGTCLLQIATAAGTGCMAYLSEDMSQVEIPLAAIMPTIVALAATAKAFKDLYDLYQNAGDYKIKTTLVS